MSAELELAAVAPERALKGRVFEALREAILGMDVYSGEHPPRLDERQLAERLGVSRTPVREALSRLEQEGLVRNEPRRGMFVVRKSRREIVEIIEVWAALESMAARLATEVADDAALERFRRDSDAHGAELAGEDGALHIDEYSAANIAFHQELIRLGGNAELARTAARSFDHMHAIRASTIRHPERTVQSLIDHRRIVEALLERRAARVERLVREHALKLARHVERHVDFLD